MQHQAYGVVRDMLSSSPEQLSAQSPSQQTVLSSYQMPLNCAVNEVLQVH